MVDVRKKMRMFEERPVVIDKLTGGFGREHDWVKRCERGGMKRGSWLGISVGWRARSLMVVQDSGLCSCRWNS